MAPAILLLGLCLYNYVDPPPLFPKGPCTNVEIGLGRVTRVGPDGEVTAWFGPKRVQFQSPGQRLERGDKVSVTGSVLPDGTLRVESVTVHTLRWLKKAASLVAMLIVFFLWARTLWKIRSQRRPPCPT